MQTTKNNNYILRWIEKLQSRGKLVFSLEQLKLEFPTIQEPALMQSLVRLANKGRVISIYKGFYLIVPTEYSSRGILPPVYFIHDLMQFVKKPYYIGLLSAAALHGAAHQQPQEFFVITDTKQKTTQKKGLKINYITKQMIPANLLEKRKTESGFVHVSTPELTAADLIYYDNRIGGINRAVSVLNELVEVMKPQRINKALIDTLTTPTIQRLGYILDVVLDKKALADKLYNVAVKQSKVFFKQPLKAGIEKKGFPKNERWKIIINIEIDIDE